MFIHVTNQICSNSVIKGHRNKTFFMLIEVKNQICSNSELQQKLKSLIVTNRFVSLCRQLRPGIHLVAIGEWLGLGPVQLLNTYWTRLSPTFSLLHLDKVILGGAKPNPILFCMGGINWMLDEVKSNKCFIIPKKSVRINKLFGRGLCLPK